MHSSRARTVLAALAILAVLVAVFWFGRRPAEQASALPSPQAKTAAIHLASGGTTRWPTE